MNKVRLNGVKLIAMGLVVTIGIILLGNLVFGAGNWHFIGYGFAIPGAAALVGLIQVVSGVPFGELAIRWESLAGWQRGVLGLIIVLLATGIIFIGMIGLASVIYE